MGPFFLFNEKVNFNKNETETKMGRPQSLLQR